MEQEYVDDQLTSGKNISFWTDSFGSPKTVNPLREDLETEVVIVGGGIAGLTTAYALAQSGQKIVLVEDGHIGSGESGRTTGHLVTAIDERYYDLERTFGEEQAKLIAQAHRSAIDFIHSTSQREEIDCDFEWVDGYLFQHPSDKEDSLRMEIKAALKAGIEVTEVQQIPGLLIAEKGLCFPRQAQFHSLKYLDGLARAIRQKGGLIFTGTHASKIDHQGIETKEGYSVRAKYVVVATNSPVNNLFSLHIKQNAYRTYVIGARIKKGLLPRALWWDTGDFHSNSKIPPYHYVRVHPFDNDYDMLISGGEDHATGDPSQGGIPEKSRYKLIEEWTRNYFPIEEVVYRWSGQVMEPIDGLAYIGHNPMDYENVFVITGDSGNGLTHGTLSGMIICDLINGLPNKWEQIYKPSRFTLRESGPVFRQMMKEFLSYLHQQPNFKSAQELATVKKGEGKLVDMLEEKFGVYRDFDGELHIVSAECTHLKCTINWNRDELSWDCPCHGSRFTYDGKVINGPANFDLPAYSENENKLEKKLT